MKKVITIKSIVIGNIKYDELDPDVDIDELIQKLIHDFCWRVSNTYKLVNMDICIEDKD